MKIFFGKRRRIALFLCSCFILWTFLRDYNSIPKNQKKTLLEQNDKQRRVVYQQHLDNNITSNALLKSRSKQLTKSPKILKHNIRKQGIKLLYKNKVTKVQKKTIIPIIKDDYGEGVNVEVAKLPPVERAKYNRLFERNSFSEYTSDLISVNRTLPDQRPQACKDKSYSSNLLQTSVIITFHNEARSALLRSVHSVINRSPSSLLKEIILVDDASNREELQAPLDEYLKDFPIMKLIRCNKREGLIRARLLGFQHATAPVATFLDSHIECAPGWLEPLLEPITKDKTIVTFPRIGYINKFKFKYNMPLLLHYGIFSWRNMNFHWVYIPKQILDSRKSEADNIKSPTMPGGLFSISKEYFTTLGTYDPKLEGWGGENLELSFKTWMCNGTLLMVTCSHVGHIFRTKIPYKLPDVSQNSFRVAEVWMDEFKHFYYDYFSPNLADLDVRDRKELRERLHCKSFEWYYRNVLSISLWTPVDALFAGQIFSLNKPGFCVDRGDGAYVKLFACNKGVIGNQNFYYTKEGMIITEGRIRNICISASSFTVTFQECDTSSHHQIWKYKNNQFQHSSMKTCLAIDQYDPLDPTTMVSCDDTRGTKWQMNPRKYKT